MPSRIIREGWLESEHIAKLDAAAERFFLRLCLRADDYGRYNANPALLKSSLFPLADDVRGTDIPRWLAACEKAGLVRCYEVDGKRFLEIARFGQRTRALSSKFPPPPGDVGHMPDTCPTDDGHARAESESESESNAESESKVGVGVGAPADAGQVTGIAGTAGAKVEAPVIPLLLNTPAFLAAWAKWQEIRRKGKKPATPWPDFFAAQLEWLATLGPDVAVETINQSIRNGWQGLFEPKGNGGGSHAGRTGKPAGPRSWKPAAGEW